MMEKKPMPYKKGADMMEKKPMPYKKSDGKEKPYDSKPMPYKKGGMVFKPCAKCPNSAKCRAMGKCMMSKAK